MEQTQKQPHTQGTGREGASRGLEAPQSTPNLLDFPHCPQCAKCGLEGRPWFWWEHPLGPSDSSFPRGGQSRLALQLGT